MIEYIKGDIIKALENGDIDAFSHGCNCQGGFGSGIAGQIAKKWPHVKDSYHSLHQIGEVKLGFFQPVSLKEKGKWIINCGTQDNYLPRGIDHVDYEAVKKVMAWTLSFSRSRGLKVGIPKIGAGLAGGNWDRISTIIEEIFDDYPIRVYVYP